MPAGDSENSAAPHQNAPKVCTGCHLGCSGEFPLSFFGAAGNGQRGSQACQGVGLSRAESGGAGGAKCGSEMADRGSGFATIPTHNADRLVRDRTLDCTWTLRKKEACALLGDLWT
jgi:hypothetical protein